MTALFADTDNRPGLLVTVDGPNGAGKTSLANAVASALREAGNEVHTTCQPSPTPLGELVRASEIEMNGRALACLVAADRHHQARTEIAEHLTAGQIVLCDRYVESSLVLQRLDGVETEFILAINSGIPRPDLRILLSATTKALEDRLAARLDDPRRRFENTAGPVREIELYGEAEHLLETRFGLAATNYDTTHTATEELGGIAAQLVLESRTGNGEPRNTDPEHR